MRYKYKCLLENDFLMKQSYTTTRNRKPTNSNGKVLFSYWYLWMESKAIDTKNWGFSFGIERMERWALSIEWNFWMGNWRQEKSQENVCWDNIDKFNMVRCWNYLKKVSSRNRVWRLDQCVFTITYENYMIVEAHIVHHSPEEQQK